MLDLEFVSLVYGFTCTPASGTQGAPGLRAWQQWEMGTLGNGDRADQRAELLSFLCRSAKNLFISTPLLCPHPSALTTGQNDIFPGALASLLAA